MTGRACDQCLGTDMQYECERGQCYAEMTNPEGEEAMVERVTRAMRQAMTAVDAGGEGSEFVAFINIEAGARAAIKAIGEHRDAEVAKLRDALNEAFDFLGGVDDAPEIRGKILAALSAIEEQGDG